MKRAAILVGVAQTGGLPRLQAVQSSIQAMTDWCAEQGISGDFLHVLTDEQRTVSVDDVFDVVKALLEGGQVEQLFVYFSGHGFNIGGQEYWLLSGAPDDPSEAINVEASIVLARRSRVPHVVFMSDACRSAPAGVQAQAITGSQIFPNFAPSSTEQSVDVFFGCTLGDPSLEIRSDDTGSEFRAMFTESLVDALRGHVPTLLEQDAEPGSYVIRGWPLKEHLQKEVTRRIRAAGLTLQARQTPDARISSPPKAWLSRLAVGEPEASNLAPPEAQAPAPLPHPPPSSGGDAGESISGEAGAGGSRAAGRHDASRSRSYIGVENPTVVLPGDVPANPSDADADAEAEATTVQSRFTVLLDAALQAPSDETPPLSPALMNDPKLRQIRNAVERMRRNPSPPDSFQVELEGQQAVDAWLPGHTPIVAGRVVVVGPMEDAPGTLLLALESGDGMLLPVLRGYVARLRFDGADLRSVRYDLAPEPGRSERNTPALLLRKAISAQAELLSHEGLLRMEGRSGALLEAFVLAQRPIDPVLALFSAYAAHDMGKTHLLQEIDRRMVRDLDADLFDTAMLAQRFFEGNRDLRVTPFAPLLSQGWGLVDVYGASLPGPVQEARHHRRNSLWSVYKPKGVAILRDYVAS